MLISAWPTPRESVFPWNSANIWSVSGGSMGIATNCQPTQKQFHGYCYKLSTPTKAVNSIHGLFDHHITMCKHTTYTTFTSRAMPFNFNSSNNGHVSTPVSRTWCTHGLHACIYYHKHMATTETMSKLKLIHALLSLQLVMLICYQNESAYFPAPYVDTSYFAVSAAQSGVTPLILQASNTTTRFSSRSSNFLQLHPKNTPETVSEGQKCQIFLWGGISQPPLLSTSSCFL